MKIERTKNAARNAAFGVLFKIEGIIFPFIIRTLMIHYMGENYVGLSSLFTSILSFLSLTELGIGQALVFSMYKPIAENDDETICALLNVYKKVYRAIGLIILSVGLILIPVLPYLVKSDCPPEINLYILYFIYLFNSSISYLLFGYKQSLLTAFHRTDIISKRSMILQMIMYLLQILVLIFLQNYYAYIVLLPLFTIFTNIANLLIVNKMYPKLKCKGDISKEQKKEIGKKVAALFGTKANAIVMHSADNIVISAFLGLSMVGRYGNYYYIMNSIIGIMTITYSSLIAGIGNSLILETPEKNYRDFRVLQFLNFSATTFCSCCLLCLYQPFMKIWIGLDRMFSIDIVVLLVIYFWIYQIRRMVLTYKDAGGLWWEDRFRPYVVMGANLVLNLATVRFIGIQGVVGSTIISMIISIPWENSTVFKGIFKRSAKDFYLSSIFQIVIAIVICITSYIVCKHLPEALIGIMLRLMVCIATTSIVIMVAFKNSAEYRSAITKINDLLKRRGS